MLNPVTCQWPITADRRNSIVVGFARSSSDLAEAQYIVQQYHAVQSVVQIVTEVPRTKDCVIWS